MAVSLGICISLYPDRDRSVTLVVSALFQNLNKSLPSSLMDWLEGKKDTI